MPDITEIAAACANRIFDRMEMCRGSAILKSDIEREVEMALHEVCFPECTLVDTEHDEFLGPVLRPAGPVYGVSPATGILGEARKSLEDYRAMLSENAPMTATEVKLDREAALESLPEGLPTFEEMQEFWGNLSRTLLTANKKLSNSDDV